MYSRSAAALFCHGPTRTKHGNHRIVRPYQSEKRPIILLFIILQQRGTRISRKMMGSKMMEKIFEKSGVHSLGLKHRGPARLWTATKSKQKRTGIHPSFFPLRTLVNAVLFSGFVGLLFSNRWGWTNRGTDRSGGFVSDGHWHFGDLRVLQNEVDRHPLTELCA